MGLFYDKFLLFGDSITQMHGVTEESFNFTGALQKCQYTLNWGEFICNLLTPEDYIRKLDVINRGYGGYSTSEAVYILPEIIAAENTPRSKVRLMTIFFGTNDAVDTFQHVELAQYEKNIEQCVQLALENGIKPIVIGPTLHDPVQYKEYLDAGVMAFEDTATSAKNKVYADAAKRVADRNGVAFVDLWNAFLAYGGWKPEDADNLHGKENGGKSIADLISDGIHIAPEGYKIMYKGIVDAIESSYPELATDNLKEHLTPWNTIDKANIRESIFRDERL